MNTWSTFWPATPGQYWFYGVLFRTQKSAETYFVTATQEPVTPWNPHPELRFSTHGVVLMREEAHGHWQPAHVPSPPQV